MKLYLASIVLLSLSQYAVADATLEFNNQISANNKSTILYQIKDKKLRFSESGSNRINMFDQAAQQFVTFDPDSKKAEMFNQEVLKERINQFNQQRLEKLARVEKELEKKLKQMSKKEQEIGESIVNQLKYPEYYGEHTALAVNPLNTSKKIGNIECTIFQLIKNKQRLKEYCLAKPSALNISSEDYQTLRSFYTFDYNMLSKLMLAMGKSDFALIDYDKENMQGIIIEVISYKGDSISQRQILNSSNTNTLSTETFTLSNNAAADQVIN